MRDFRLVVEFGSGGLVYVTSSAWPGLLVAEHSLAAALAAVPQAIEDLERARPLPASPW